MQSLCFLPQGVTLQGCQVRGCLSISRPGPGNLRAPETGTDKARRARGPAWSPRAGQSPGRPQPLPPSPHWSCRGEVGSDGTAWGGGRGTRRSDCGQSGAISPGAARPAPAQRPAVPPTDVPPTRLALCWGQAVFVTVPPLVGLRFPLSPPLLGPDQKASGAQCHFGWRFFFSISF